MCIDALNGYQFADYTLQSIIGRGGMGVVYLALDNRTQQQIAIKALDPLMHETREGSRQALARFKREARIISQLQHPHIIQLTSYIEDSGFAFIVMPYIRGGNLHTLMQRQETGTLTLTQAVYYLQQMASALDYAHSHKVIHRDLKPTNFLLDSDGRLLLADFGIARFIANPDEDDTWTQNEIITHTESILGTAEYIAPETFHRLSRDIDKRADIYSLGIVLYQMITGSLPFRSSNIFTLAEMHKSMQLPSVRSLDPSLPSGIDAILRKATAKDREQRYISALKLAETFQHIVQNTVNTPTEAIDRTRGHPLSYIYPSYTSSAASSNQPHYVLPTIDQVAQPLQHVPLMAPSTESAVPTHAAKKPTKKKQAALNIPIIFFLALLAIFMAFVSFHPPTLLKANTQYVKNPSQQTVNMQLNLTDAGKQAQQMVQAFYANINARNFQGAYALLSTQYQQGQSYEKFVQGYEYTIHDTVTVQTPSPNSDGTLVTLMLTIQATEDRGGITRQSTYTALCIAGKVGNLWKIQSQSQRKVK
ncbi:serine/threonine protein kinase [Ktedonobacteria bacterium brp13]|nr:serine/threonine protein kinase [Ktedonobacteria bacterium brp13]